MTLIISGFPGVGKSYYYDKKILEEGYKIADSDSNRFDKKDFPCNYIEHIKNLSAYNYDIILISSHKEVREELNRLKIEYCVVYPNLTCKDEYIERYTKCGNTKEFINFIDKNWYDFIMDMEIRNLNIYRESLASGEYLGDQVVNSYKMYLDKKRND